MVRPTDPATTATSPLVADRRRSRCRPASRATCASSSGGCSTTQRQRTVLRRRHRRGRRHRRRRRPVDAVGSAVGQRADRSTPARAPNAGSARRFGGDSLGWVASRVDLSRVRRRRPSRRSSRCAPTTVVGYVGWCLDDISVYTCDGGTCPARAPSARPCQPLDRRARASAGRRRHRAKVTGGLDQAAVRGEAEHQPRQRTGYQTWTGDHGLTAAAASCQRLKQGKTTASRSSPLGSATSAARRHVTVHGTETTLKVTRPREDRAHGRLLEAGQGPQGQGAQGARPEERQVGQGRQGDHGQGRQVHAAAKHDQADVPGACSAARVSLMGSQSPKRHL